MTTCHTCQSQLLHHLYGLLDDADHQAVIAHLGVCAECRAALDTARDQQQIFAAAVKAPFPELRFKAVEQPAAKQLPAPVRRPRTWRRWAMAACIVLAVGVGVGYPAFTWISHDLAVSSAQKELAEARSERDAALAKHQDEQRVLQSDMARLQQQLEIVEVQYRNDLARVVKQYESQPVEFTVSHPKTLQAGGPNQITIDAKRKPGIANVKNLDLIAMVVEDKTKTPLARMALKDGTNDFVLPADLPLKPGTQLSLRVLATEAGQKDQTLIDESLPLVTSLYVTHLMTDRPIYRPGEVVHFRSLTLERFSLKPADDEFVLLFRFVKMMGEKEQIIDVADPATGRPAQMIGSTRLTGKSGTPLLGPDGGPIRGIGAGEFLLHPDLPGGEYTLVVSEASERFPAEKRKIIVNRYQAPRLYKDVDFTRKSYGPGDMVTATCKVSPVEGGRVLAKLPVKASATVDGQPCKLMTEGALVTDDRGQCIVQFQLPAKIERGEGMLTVVFEDGANVETTVEPIPIVLNKLNVEFFPEGGELVAGVPNRVYFQVRTMLGKPAELRGQIVDKSGKEVAAIHTFNDDKEIGVNQGMGRFDFTPVDGERYELNIESPTGIEGPFWLSPVQSTGVVLHLSRGVVSEKIELLLHNVGKARKLLVGAYCRGQLLDHQTVTVDAGKSAPLTLKPATQVGGVYRVTVFEVNEGDGPALKPVAERLLYRHSPDKLNLQIFTDKKLYTPGDRVTLSLNATDQHNKPAPAIVVVSVVDKSILKLRNERTARAMPTHFLLTSEVRGPEDLEYADFLLLDESRGGLDPGVDKAQTALDLLLGTQGWRRFVEQKTPVQRDQSMAAFKEDTKRLLTVNGQAPQQQIKESTVSHSAARVISAAAIKHEKLQRELGAVEDKLETNLENKAQQQEQLDADLATRGSELSVAENERRVFVDRMKSFTTITLIAGFAVLALVLVCVGIARANKEQRFSGAFMLTGVLCLCVMMLGVAVWMKDDVKIREASFRTGAVALEGMARDEADVRELRQKQQGTATGAKTEMRPAWPPADRTPDVGVGFLAKSPGKKTKMASPPPPKEVVVIDGSKSMEVIKESDMADVYKGKPTGYWQRGFGKMDYARMADLVLPNLGRELRAEGKFAEASKKRLALLVDGRDAGKVKEAYKALMTADAFGLREYAHQHKTSADYVRRDFAETVYWHPALVLPGDKALDVQFDLSDAVTQFQVQVWAHTLDGRLSAVTKDIASRLPFSLDAKLPIEISSTDKIAIPIALANDSEKNRHVKLTIESENLKLLGEASYLLPLNANSRLRKVVTLQPGVVQGEAKLRLMGLCDPFGSDSIEHSFKIVPEGFPVVGKRSDMLEKASEFQLKLPARREEWVKGTMKLQAQVIPSTLAELQKGLESLLREPGGCFEQTSSSNYPNVMILDYLKESGQIRPDLEKTALAMLERGYARLITFECANPSLGMRKEGYEWFGQTAPPHPALTAYGLLQFTDMAKHITVDQAMLGRTKGYLLNQRDKKGGFLPDNRRLDKIGKAPDAVTNAYILWALCEAGLQDNISLELDTVANNASRSEDPYQLALASLSLLKRGHHDRALPLLKTLKAMQKSDGKLTARETSITLSAGSQLEIETTALSVLAWLRANQPVLFGENVRTAADWIGKQRGGFGGYGSTQSTVLALKALVAFTHENKKTAEAGELRLIINGQQVAAKPFAAGTVDPVTVELPDEAALLAGDNSVRVEITGKNVFPYTVTWSYMALTPANKDACPVRLETTLSAKKVDEGESVRVTALLKNVSGQDQGMAVAIIGLPGGCALPADMQELRNLVKAGKIDAYEIRGRELVLYWRALAKDAALEVNFSVICQVPGQYRGPASRAYLYYNADERWWVSPLAVDIAAK